MRTLKKLGFVPVALVLALSTGAYAREYGKAGSMTQPMKQGGAQVQKQPQAMEMPGVGQFGSGRLGQGEGAYYYGSLTAIDQASSQIIVKTQVPGLLGPQTADAAFNTTPSTTLSVCFRSTGACDAYFADQQGWNALANLQKVPALTAAQKQVIVVGNPNTSEVLHVQITYGP